MTLEACCLPDETVLDTLPKENVNLEVLQFLKSVGEPPVNSICYVVSPQNCSRRSKSESSKKLQNTPT